MNSETFPNKPMQRLILSKILAFIALMSFIILICTSYAVANEVTFTEISKISGIKVSKPTYGNPTWIDIDNNGYIDSFVINHKAAPSLFRNNGNGTFTNIQPISGIIESSDRHGAAWGDYDNDGDLDLFVTVGAFHGTKIGAKKDQLYKNNGNSTFTNVTDIANVLNTDGRGRSVNWVDFDNDGHLDIFVKNKSTKNVLYRNNKDGTFTDISISSGISDAPGEVSSWNDYDKDGYMDLFTTLGTKDTLWRNNADGTFTDITSKAGIKAISHGQSLAWGDYNNDGNIDLFRSRGYTDVDDTIAWNASRVAFSDQESGKESGIDVITTGNLMTFDLYLQKCRQSEMVSIGNGNIEPLSIPFTLSSEEATGKPSYVPGKDIGFFIWKENDTWRIRWSSDETTTYFYGKLSSDGQIISVAPLNFKKKISY